VKGRLLGLIACVALLAGFGAAQADVIVLFSGTGKFTDGVTLAGTMNVDVSAGCVVGSAGCTGGGASAPTFTVSAYPAETFILGANPGFVAPNTVELPLVSHPFCCGDLSMQILFTTPDAADIVGYDGGPITGGQVVADCGVNGVCDLHSGLTGSFTSASSAVPEPSTWAMMLVGFAGLGLLARRIRNRGGLSTVKHTSSGAAAG
jgi:PEP-CTERM motif